MYYCAVPSTGLTSPVKTLFSELRSIGQRARAFLSETLEKKMMPPRITPTKYATVIGDHSVLTY